MTCRGLLAVAVLASALSGCGDASGGMLLNGLGVQNGGPAFVSGTSPQSAGSNSQSDPQPQGSLPGNSLGVGGGPNAYLPNFGAVTIGGPSD